MLVIITRLTQESSVDIFKFEVLKWFFTSCTVEAFFMPVPFERLHTNICYLVFAMSTISDRPVPSRKNQRVFSIVVRSSCRRGEWDGLHDSRGRRVNRSCDYSHGVSRSYGGSDGGNWSGDDRSNCGSGWGHCSNRSGGDGSDCGSGWRNSNGSGSRGCHRPCCCRRGDHCGMSLRCSAFHTKFSNIFRTTNVANC